MPQGKYQRRHSDMPTASSSSSQRIVELSNKGRLLNTGGGSSTSSALISANKSGDKTLSVQYSSSSTTTDDKKRRRSSTTQIGTRTRRTSSKAGFEMDKKRRQSIIEIVQDMDYTGRVLPVIRVINGFLQIINSILIALGVTKFDGAVVFFSASQWPRPTEAIAKTLNIAPAERLRFFSVNWQYPAIALTIVYAIYNIATVVFQLRTKKLQDLNSRLCVIAAFSGVPMMALLFYAELHYSWCPWIDTYYRNTGINIGKEVKPIHCNAYSWLAASVVASICAFLFIVDGLITLNLGDQEKLGENASDVDGSDMLNSDMLMMADSLERSHRGSTMNTSNILDSLQY